MSKSDKLDMENNVDELKTKDEIAPADEGVDDEENINIFKLRKPIPNGGEPIAEIHLDFDKITGRDILAIERELNSIGNRIVMPTTSMEFAIRVFVLAAEESIDVEFMERMGAVDFNNAINKTRFFLLGLA